MKFDICGTTANLLSEKAKDSLRPNWAGVDFYDAICVQCWDAEADRR